MNIIEFITNFVKSHAEQLILSIENAIIFNKIYTKTKLQFVMRNSIINNFEVKAHTPFLNCCIIKLCFY